MDQACEVNFDGIVGPTHNYAGLSHGNLASMKNRGAGSNPRAAALQGLAKMKALADLGLKQAVLPPHERPHLPTLRGLGFSGSDARVLAKAAKQAPELLVACASASGMWVANAATVAPAADARDGRVHFTPANLVSKIHRSIEPPQTTRTLRAIFSDEERFVVHEPVGGGAAMGDEGAANHTRFAPRHALRGIHLFVHGHHGSSATRAGPKRFLSRQSREASAAVARRHLLPEDTVCFAQQHPAAIDAGVFHNDVISVGNENTFLHHERAFVNTRSVVDELRRKFAKLNRGAELIVIKVPVSRVTLPDAVRSYLFNSQLVTLREGRMALIAAKECREIPRVRHFVEELVASGRTPICEVRYFDLRESMRNGGGPACLRLRVVLTPREHAAVSSTVELTESRHAILTDWVKRHYRDKLSTGDLADPQLLEESRAALDELTRILGLGSIYPFQISP